MRNVRSLPSTNESSELASRRASGTPLPSKIRDASFSVSAIELLLATNLTALDSELNRDSLFQSNIERARSSRGAGTLGAASFEGSRVNGSEFNNVGLTRLPRG